MIRLSLGCAALVAGLFAVGSASAEDFKLGVAGPFTGVNASFGSQLQVGVRQAVEDINAKGGVLGHKISLEEGDDASDPKQGISVANKFVGDGVKYVVGHFNSGVTIPASAVYADNDILMISPSATNPTLTEKGLWNTFRVCGRDDQQGVIAAKYIADHFKDKRIAVLHDKTTYGKGLADAVIGNLAKVGMKPVLYDGVNTGEKDYSAITSKLKAANIDMLYWGGLQTEGGLIRRQMGDQGVKATMMSGDGIANSEFAPIAGPAAEGTIFSFPPDPRKNPNAAEVMKEFEAKKEPTEGYVLYSYAAVQVLNQAAEAAKSIDPHKMADAMHSGMVFHTVIGDVSFDKKGDRTVADYVMYTFKKGPDGVVNYSQMD